MRAYRRPHSYKRKKSILKNRFFWLGILAVVFLFSIFYFVFLSETFQVKKIIITGENKTKTEDIKSVAENKLENKILFFKTKVVFLVNSNQIKEDILNQFPQIAAVEIKKGFPDALDILVVERMEIANWCQNEHCFLLDNEGVIFEELSEVKPHSIIIRELLARGEAILGERVIEKENLSKILEIEKGVENLKVPIKEFQISSEDKLIVLTQENWEIYFTLQSDIQWQMTKLRAVLETKIPSEKRQDLEYIEVRFGNFAPFRYR